VAVVDDKLVLQRARVRDVRRLRRVIVAIVIGVCAWDDSSDLAWTDPAPRVVSAHVARAGTHS
jgi:hypothetical protein